ncbi:hypothetical protein [Companilactobacillus mishanensis]|uniref:hypothetical protein n=1 Tax=Companilactobacillus mishanensis TaxID=2486008 RepID=UPI000F778721|nr:hypothetical protein [Companilactobacillus mishanensis]
MKKSIKYAGVAAATLLMVAPVAAPAFNLSAPTTSNTAKATFDNATEEDAYNAFDSTFKDYNNATKLDFTYAAAFATVGPLQTNNRYTYTGQKLDGVIKPLHPQYQSFLFLWDATK